MKLRLLLFQVLAILISGNAMAQWQKTGATSKYNDGIHSICEHDGSLYGAVDSRGLIKWNSSTSTWDSIGYTGFPPNIGFNKIDIILSAGTSLYVFVNNAQCGSTMTYKSADNGLTFTADTSGLPINACNKQHFRVERAWSLDGTLIAEVGTGAFSKKPGDAAWVHNKSVTQFSSLWDAYDNTWYAFTSYKLHTSTDEGVTWNTPTNTDLPTQYAAKTLNVNSTTGRIYVTGSTLVSQEYGMFYSDDEGASWDSLPINALLGKDWIGQKQKVNGIISKGSDITITLVNDANNSHPDVLSSTDGGQTYSVDTAGLQSNAFGTIAPRKMLYFNNELYIAFSFNGIYKKGGTPTNSVATLNTLEFNVYPNPVSDKLNLQSDSQIDHVEVYTLQGSKVMEQNLAFGANSVNLQGLERGIYIIKVSSQDSWNTLKIIKE